jgi:hypothetical protein
MNAVPVPHAPCAVHSPKFRPADALRDLLAGRQPKGLTLSTFIEADLPLTWTEQRALLRGNVSV